MSEQTIETTALAVREERAVTAADFSPVFTIEQALERKRTMNQFIGKVLEEGSDYGKIPGAGEKKVLLKAGAEKMCSIFGLAPSFSPVQTIEDWTGAEHGGEALFYYEYRCQLTRGQRFAGEGIGSCNSWESKYRYRWIGELEAKQRPDFDRLHKKGGRISEPVFAIDKGETAGQYGKPAEYWQRFRDGIADGSASQTLRKTKAGKDMMCWEIDGALYRVPNDQFADVINTCQKMGQKRALVAAVLVVTNCSDAFTQDIEDEIDMNEPQAGSPAREEKREEKRSPASTTAPAAPRPLRKIAVKRGNSYVEMDIESWRSGAEMITMFKELFQRCGVYDGVWRHALKLANVEAPEDFLKMDNGPKLAGLCYLDLLGKVLDFEAAANAPAVDPEPDAFAEHMAATEPGATK